MTKTFLLLVLSLSAWQVRPAPLQDARADGSWFSLSPTMHFQPADLTEADPDQMQSLRQAQHRFLSYNRHFVDSTETKYDAGSQAWRLLGYYIDCGSAYEAENRRLEEGGEDGEGEGEGGENDGENENNEEGENNADGDEDGQNEDGQNQGDEQADAQEEKAEQQCSRYMLWAAYVDLDYTGGGIGEYQYFDTETNTWDQSACDLHGTKRCARMDCHLPGSNFKLLGFFKEYDSYDFLEQLFKHEGSCLWSDDTTSYMENALENFWPQGCQQSATVNSGGQPLYTDIKPLKGGKATIGLYTDDACKSEFYGQEKLDVGDVLYADGLDVGEFDEFIDTWNTALAPFRVCQPCMTYDLSNSFMKSYGNNNNNNENENQYELADDGNEGYFTCLDYAGAVQINQCSKFATKTYLTAASSRDLAMATGQGTIAASNLSTIDRTTSRDWWSKWGFFTIACILYVTGIIMTIVVRKKRRSSRSQVGSNKQPLME